MRLPLTFFEVAFQAERDDSASIQLMFKRRDSKLCKQQEKKLFKSCLHVQLNLKKPVQK